MSDGGTLVNLGKLSKPATVLIEKISEAIGGFARPHQIKRIAKAQGEANIIAATAEAEAAMIRAQSRIQISEIEERALQRLVREEGRKQQNIENITGKAVSLLPDDARPEDLEIDWLAHFFERARMASDSEMQSLWGRILAGESCKNGGFSKKTIDIVSALSKADAELFTNLCTFAMVIGAVSPLVFDMEDALYESKGITFSSLNHLASMGLIVLNDITDYQRIRLPKEFFVFYYGAPLLLELPLDKDNKIITGKAMFTKAGEELANVCGSKPSGGFLSFIIEKWINSGIPVSAPIGSRLAWERSAVLNYP